MRPSGSATARYPRAISSCSRNATTASVPKVIRVAFTTRWYSTVPVPMLRISRRPRRREGDHPDHRDGRAERQVGDVALRRRGTERSGPEAHELRDEERGDDDRGIRRREGEHEPVPPTELARLRGDALPDGCPDRCRAVEQALGRGTDERHAVCFSGQRSFPLRGGPCGSYERSEGATTLPGRMLAVVQAVVACELERVRSTWCSRPVRGSAAFPDAAVDRPLPRC